MLHIKIDVTHTMKEHLWEAKVFMNTYTKHLFICTRCTEQTGKMGGGKELKDLLKAATRELPPFAEKSYRISESGCLGQCKKGISAVLYPEQTWITELETADAWKMEHSLERLQSALNLPL
jgi:(2Fe-2S) ferredoxin